MKNLFVVIFALIASITIGNADCIKCSELVDEMNRIIPHNTLYNNKNTNKNTGAVINKATFVINGFQYTVKSVDYNGKNPSSIKVEFTSNIKDNPISGSFMCYGKNSEMIDVKGRLNLHNIDKYKNDTLVSTYLSEAEIISKNENLFKEGEKVNWSLEDKLQYVNRRFYDKHFENVLNFYELT